MEGITLLLIRILCCSLFEEHCKFGSIVSTLENFAVLVGMVIPFELRIDEVCVFFAALELVTAKTILAGEILIFHVIWLLLGLLLLECSVLSKRSNLPLEWISSKNISEYIVF